MSNDSGIDLGAALGDLADNKRADDNPADDERAALALPDLAGRALGGSVAWSNDEFYAARENLITAGPSIHDPLEFNYRGKVYDGWETRRRREPGDDSVIVRLGCPGLVRAIVVDTSWFKGNYPPFASLEAATVFGYPSAQELLEATWTPLATREPLRGHAANVVLVKHNQAATHIRLTIHPDGGVARLRVHGEVLADPRFLGGRIDLAALTNGGRITACSNMFYSSPSNLISPGLASVMSDGWETARRRDDGNDWVTVELAAPGILHDAIIDTSYFVGNAPGWAALRGIDARRSDIADDDAWRTVLPRVRLQPDTQHRLRIADDSELTHVRLDIYPDGGVARLRLHGEVAPSARGPLVQRWLDAVPPERAAAVLAESGAPAPDIGAWATGYADPGIAELIAGTLMT
ncbi:MAG: allantoicase [Pseudonocardiales bacterium]|nr:allantoicase [Pseudonocardiales bacterium]